jgi:hypothetical protein
MVGMCCCVVGGDGCSAHAHEYRHAHAHAQDTHTADDTKLHTTQNLHTPADVIWIRHLAIGPGHLGADLVRLTRVLHFLPLALLVTLTTQCWKAIQGRVV